MRPVSSVLTRLSVLLESVGLSPRTISVAVSLQPIPTLTLRSGIAKVTKSTCIDLNALKNGRIKFSAKGSKYSTILHGKTFF